VQVELRRVSLLYPLLDGSVDDVPVDARRARLTDAVAPLHRLLLDSQVSPRVTEMNVISGDEVQTDAAGFQRFSSC
jgi:hypothetical protein